MAKNNNDSNWLGWVGFGAFMLMLGGFFSLVAGFAALFKETVVYHSATNTAWVLNYDQWGWAHILLGVLALVAASSLLAGHIYGRIVAVTIALLSAAANVVFIPVYPIWSLLVITIDVLVIYAVIAHAGELRE